MTHRNHRQLRAIRNYANALKLHPEAAALRWCVNGLAARWAEYNDG